MSYTENDLTSDCINNIISDCISDLVSELKNEP